MQGATFQGVRLNASVGASSASARRCVVAKVQVKDKVSVTIARSLAQVASKLNKLTEIKGELDQVAEAIMDPKIQAYFDNPTIYKPSKTKYINSVASKAGLSKEMTTFLAFLVDGKYMGLIGEIKVAFEQIYGERTSTKTVLVTSYKELTEDQQFKLAKKLQALTNSKNVVISPKVDPALEGGFKVEFDSYLLDYSVRGNYVQIVNGMKKQCRDFFGKIPYYIPGGHLDPYATGEYGRKLDKERVEQWEKDNKDKIEAWKKEDAALQEELKKKAEAKAARDAEKKAAAEAAAKAEASQES